MKLDLIKDSNGTFQILLNEVLKEIIYPINNESSEECQQRALRKYESLLTMYMNNKHLIKNKNAVEIQVLRSITF